MELAVVSSVLFFASPISRQQEVGYGVSVAGLYLYREYKVCGCVWVWCVGVVWVLCGCVGVCLCVFMCV